MMSNRKVHSNVHCERCFIPIEEFKYKLESYKKDKSCELIFDFKEYIFENKKNKFYEKELINFLRTKKAEHQEVENFERTIEELIMDFVDVGFLENVDGLFEKQEEWY